MLTHREIEDKIDFIARDQHCRGLPASDIQDLKQTLWLHTYQIMDSRAYKDFGYVYKALWREARAYRKAQMKHQSRMMLCLEELEPETIWDPGPYLEARNILKDIAAKPIWPIVWRAGLLGGCKAAAETGMARSWVYRCLNSARMEISAAV